MKKVKTCRILLTALLLLVVVGIVVYRLMLSTPSEELSPKARVAAILEEGGCLSCHTANAELPFYADFPLAGDLIKADIEEGYRAFDIAPLMEALSGETLPNPVDVAKVERVALDKSMPEAKYYLMHWGSQMTDAKADIIAAWARDYRTDYYNDGLTGERAGEPIRPIVPATDIDEHKALLGFKLYHDTRLSVDNTISCASCHGLETGGVDNHQYSDGVEGRMGGVNAPTVYNAVYNFVQFWDGRARTLAEQAAGPPLNPVEMASTSFDEIIGKLSADELYVATFASLYPEEGITEASITNAIEEFERTLTTPNSQFDKWLRGDDTALTAQELRGYELFKANSCATCHVGANLGGETYELMGLRRHYFEERGLELTEEDNGRFKQTQDERDRHRFKVPGLRNIELTWPYYHDGTRLTMDEAVRDMALYQCDTELSDAEVTDIVAFLRTLTGEYQGKKLSNVNEYGVVFHHDDDDHHHHHHDHDGEHHHDHE
ncbi:MAG: heme-binding domain-containing protein [Alistipes sp.]|nr:heme-binding domain-containing protein [Alistipes sp.]